MTDEELFEKLRNGEMVDDVAEPFVRWNRVAAEQLRAYNGSFGQPLPQRVAILKKLLKRCGEHVHMEPGFRCEFGFHISIGEHFYANVDFFTIDSAEITIGDHVLIGPRCCIFTANHAIDPEERAASAMYAKPVAIGDRVWLGGNVTILPGVTIGENSIIGAGSVVPKDIPANVIAAGNPCRVIREITEQDKTGYIPSP